MTCIDCLVYTFSPHPQFKFISQLILWNESTPLYTNLCNVREAATNIQKGFDSQSIKILIVLIFHSHFTRGYNADERG